MDLERRLKSYNFEKLSPGVFDENIVKMAVENGLTIVNPEEVFKSVVMSWGAFYGNILIGNISLTLRENIYLLDLFFVNKNFRRKGVGKRLLSFLIEYMHVNNIPKVYSFTKEPVALVSLGGFKVRDNYIAKKVKHIYQEDCDSCPEYEKTCFPAIISFS